jgi:HEAT repeat protein
LAAKVLARLEESDKGNEKFLSNEIKSKLVLALGKMKAEDALPYLRKTASDTANDKYLIMFAMVALGDMQDTASLEIMKKNLSEPEIKVQEYAAYSISILKAKEAVPVLRDMLKNNDEKIRIYACQGLALNGDNDSIKILLYKIKNDPAATVKKEALSALMSMGAFGVNALKEIYKDKTLSDNETAELCDAVKKKPTAENVEYIVSLYDKSDKKKKDIIAKYILFGNSKALDKITDIMLNSDDPYVRMNAIKTVYQTKDSTLWGKVKEISEKDKDDNVKKTAKNYIDLKSK